VLILGFLGKIEMQRLKENGQDTKHKVGTFESCPKLAQARPL